LFPCVLESIEDEPKGNKKNLSVYLGNKFCTISFETNEIKNKWLVALNFFKNKQVNEMIVCTKDLELLISNSSSLFFKCNKMNLILAYRVQIEYERTD
jgi:hypothetical protein